MVFSDSFLEILRQKISLADLIGQRVTWDEKKTRRGKGDFWAPCPFHTEKTASFHVDDNKGFYYCFGCHAKGDAFKFLKEIENYSFIESVELLCKKTGTTLPTQIIAHENKRKDFQDLYQIMELASKFFQFQLHTQNGKKALNYLLERGLSEETLKKFELGFAPSSSSALFNHLRSKSIQNEKLVLLGLSIKPEDGRCPFDRFRNRIIFPIKDSSGKTIAFGGRSLDAETNAKYLNSPETPLFNKSKTLYNFKNARSPSKKKDSLIVVEGYMDVVSLNQAGFDNVVAPLGTAITEQQLRLLWQLHAEPLIALDGDAAGIRASEKLMDTALPYLAHNKSLRFCMLPENQDPDDLIKSGGAQALQTAIDEAIPLVQLLWNQHTRGKIFDSPERKASLDVQLKASLNKISDKNLRNHFSVAVRKLRYNFLQQSDSFLAERNNSNYSFTKKPFRNKNTAKPIFATKNSILAKQASNLNVEARLREGAILLVALNHPKIADELEQEICQAEFFNEDLEIIRNALLSELPFDGGLSHEGFLNNLKERLNFDPIKKLNEISHLSVQPFLHRDANEKDAKKAIQDALFRHSSIEEFKKEIKSAEKEISESENEELTSRISKANLTMKKAEKGIASVPVSSDEEALEGSQELEDMIRDEIWLKKK